MKRPMLFCPLDEETSCGYWCDFGGYLLPVIKAFQKHVVKDHSDLSVMDTRTTGGLIDRWIGDMMVKTVGRPREED